MLILLDQDGVLADFEQGFYDAWNASMGTEFPAVELQQRRSFYVRDDYPAHYANAVQAIYTRPGFYRDLPPVAGAMDAVKMLCDMGHDVRICTSPLNQYRNCIPEKYEWVEHYLGIDFVSRVIVTKDKTLVAGDVLVDDKPVIAGAHMPVWAHVIYDQPYNRQLAGVRVSWLDWNGVLPGV